MGSMKSGFLLAILVLLGCAERTESPFVRPSGPSLTEYDKDLFDLVLADFASYIKSRESVTKVFFDASTPGKSGMLSDDQMGVDLERKGHSVPTDVSVHLRGRNHGSVPLSDYKPGQQEIAVADLDLLPGQNDLQGFEFWYGQDEKSPERKAWVHTWLPGYSNDGRTAIVRFWFGPTPHGAIGTYLLTRRDGKWKVKWRSFSYYV